MKTGGTSYNTNAGSKKGISGNHKCAICSRIYKQQWTKDIHERKCKEFHNAKKGEE